MTNKEMGEGLDVRELLKNTLSKLCERHNHQEIVLLNRALAKIADDSDWHRTRIGYMGYDSIGLFQFNDKTWAVARGEKYGSYPADPFDSDILALEFIAEGKTSEQIEKELIEGIQRSSYFVNSLVYGLADGSLAVSKNGRLGQRMLELIRPGIERFIAQEPEYDLRHISLSTLTPVCKKPILYKVEFADFLSDSIETVLQGSG